MQAFHPPAVGPESGGDLVVLSERGYSPDVDTRGSEGRVIVGEQPQNDCGFDVLLKTEG
ncbi:MAG: hypothetical protein ACRDZ8_00220 [Acidimicrobiales bacterium]